MSSRQERLEALKKVLEESEGPLSGSVLAERLCVSRQAIVQDVAALREDGIPVVATSRGYGIDRRIPMARRVVAVCHQADRLFQELSLIVSLGGRVLDVFIDHPIYGELRGNVDVGSMEDVNRFLTLMEATGRHPLLTLSDGFHLHTIEASCEGVLQEIEDRLGEKGFLVQF